MPLSSDLCLLQLTGVADLIGSAICLRSLPSLLDDLFQVFNFPLSFPSGWIAVVWFEVIAKGAGEGSKSMSFVASGLGGLVEATSMALEWKLTACFAVNNGIFVAEMVGRDLAQSHHPLDPLTPQEIQKTTLIIQKSHYGSLHNLTFHFLDLDEPPKQDVLKWLISTKQNGPFPACRAQAVIRANDETRELIIDLIKNSILSDKTSFHKLPISRLDFEKRAQLIGNYIFAPEHGLVRRARNKKARSGHVFGPYFYRGEGTSNVWARPIEGLGLLIDLEAQQVVEFVDRLKARMPKAEGTDFRAGARPIHCQTNKSNVEVNGQQVRWGNWKFHVALDVRAGLVISTASVYDNVRRRFRSVLYRGHVSETFVPYMNPTPEWHYRTFMDVGEFGFGRSASNLVPLVDCPCNAVYVDEYVAGGDGRPQVIERAICVFESYGGNITNGEAEISLVVRMVATVGTYDYILDWEFKNSGSIKVGGKE
ncbi:amine oxidase [Striga asiatica]|uniref:Amine oxidase n=1 Tax=Striga asiatica TaxID=4170 RepID=A0A5A7QIH8_STRAF|nr:amine oxidase [Striga asiatica]